MIESSQRNTYKQDCCY